MGVPSFGEGRATGGDCERLIWCLLGSYFGHFSCSESVLTQLGSFLKRLLSQRIRAKASSNPPRLAAALVWSRAACNALASGLIPNSSITILRSQSVIMQVLRVFLFSTVATAVQAAVQSTLEKGGEGVEAFGEREASPHFEAGSLQGGEWKDALGGEIALADEDQSAAREAREVREAEAFLAAELEAPAVVEAAVPRTRDPTKREIFFALVVQSLVVVLTVAAVNVAYKQMGCPFKRFPLKYLVKYIAPKPEGGAVFEEAECDSAKGNVSSVGDRRPFAEAQ